MATLGLQGLPAEIIHRILDLAIPVQRLKAQELIDVPPAARKSPSGIPSLFLVSRTIYEHAAPIFYSRAVLSIAPIRPPAYLFNTFSSPGLKLNLRIGLDVVFAFCNPHHLRRIKTVEVFSGQVDAITAEAYEALLAWLVERTAVKNIHLSNRLMTRLRKGRTDINLTHSLATATPAPSLTRTIHVYTRHRRSPWEMSRMVYLRQALRGRHLPIVQLFIYGNFDDHDPFLDPRWDARKSDSPETVVKLDEVITFFDGLAAEDQVLSSYTATAEVRLYQVLFVLDHVPSREDLSSSGTAESQSPSLSNQFDTLSLQET